MERWKIQTSGKVEFRPFQEAAADFPQVPAEEFRKAVYLFEAGSISSGAEAVFRIQAYGSAPWFLRAYRFLPGFRAVSDFFYSLIASNRVFFSRVTRLLWGRDPRPDSYFCSRKLFFKSLALIYISAFASLWPQIPGLFGERGILPVGHYLQAVSAYFSGSAQRFYAVPSLAWLNPSAVFLQGICVAGVFFALLILAGRAVRLSSFALWLLYLSLVVVGQDFLSFQWDILLLETGLLAVFFAPLSKGFSAKADWDSQSIPVSRFLLQFLLFKLMISSGIVKLASGDPVWRNLTALNYHYETQPLPGPLSWYAHQLPAWFDRVCAAVMFFIELAAPFFLFFPRRIRHFGVLLLAGLQILIFLTGNYCFFNLLALALCLTVVDDTVWRRGVKTESVRKTPIGMRLAILPVAVVFLAVSCKQVLRLAGVPMTGTISRVESSLRPFESLNSYGLFAVMTTRRPEIVVEGSLDGKEWKPYVFRFKPGDIQKRPGAVAPYQPRLDWQMWFAALGRGERNPWFIQFCMRLLQGVPEVSRLLASDPFAGKPPKYLRAAEYDYRFTSLKEKWRTGAWWKREYTGNYLPVMALNQGTASREIADNNQDSFKS